MLLEEAILYLLRHSGYVPIENAGADPTLRNGHSGLEVCGRGGVHQIDAVADFSVPQPFANAQRLLVEAKCFSDQYEVGLPLVRNAVGVLKDVSEFWVGAPAAPKANRYHYSYALFSASDFSNDAERYAFAHDIYLLPLKKSRFSRPIVEAIREFGEEEARLLAAEAPQLRLKDLRRATRDALRRGAVPAGLPQVFSRGLSRLLEACEPIKEALLAVIGGRLPVLLIAAPDVSLHQLPGRISVRIRWDARGWYLFESNTGRRLFSFDLPPELFLLYSEAGALRPERALDIKADFFSEFSALVVTDGQLKRISFALDLDWLGDIRTRLQAMSREKEATQD